MDIDMLHDPTEAALDRMKAKHAKIAAEYEKCCEHTGSNKPPDRLTQEMLDSMLIATNCHRPSSWRNVHALLQYTFELQAKLDVQLEESATDRVAGRFYMGSMTDERPQGG